MPFFFFWRLNLKYLEDLIIEKGRLIDGNILKVDSFLNHQIDVTCLNELGKEFYRLFEGDGVTKILTIEASGIAIACIAAQYFGVPVVFAKKSKSSNISDSLYSTKVASFTHGTTYDVVVSKEYLSSEDRVLVIDDFLARGNALIGLKDIVSQAGASLVGCGIAIEKEFQGGGNELRASGVRVESLAKIASMDSENGIVFA